LIVVAFAFSPIDGHNKRLTVYGEPLSRGVGAGYRRCKLCVSEVPLAESNGMVAFLRLVVPKQDVEMVCLQTTSSA